MCDVTYLDKKAIIRTLIQELNFSLEDAFFIIRSNNYKWYPFIFNAKDLGENFVKANYPKLSKYITKNIDYTLVGSTIINDFSNKFIFTDYKFTSIGLIKLYYY